MLGCLAKCGGNPSMSSSSAESEFIDYWRLLNVVRENCLFVVIDCIIVTVFLIGRRIISYTFMQFSSTVMHVLNSISIRRRIANRINDILGQFPSPREYAGQKTVLALTARIGATLFTHFYCAPLS